MAGEIRTKMAQLRAARKKLTDDLSATIDGLTGDVAATHADGLEALRLPQAELEATRQEIREIREEFAPKSNGAPSGSADTGAGAQGKSPATPQSSEQPKKPDPSWLPQK